MTKKEEKARLKIEKKRAKAGAKASSTGEKSLPGPVLLDDGIGITVHRRGGGTDLVVSGLAEEQVRRVLPHVSREVMIALAADRSAFRAGLLSFVREGIFQTVVKIAAGLVVGYLLLRLGLR